jgi:hypothetical protein
VSVIIKLSIEPRWPARWAAARRLIPVVLVALIGSSACAGSAGSPSAGGSATCDPAAGCDLSTGSVAPGQSASIPGAGGAPTLIVLADGVNGGEGLWKLGADGTWTTIGPIADGQAIARDGSIITIARAGTLETRSVTTPGQTATTLPLKWTGFAPSAPIVAVDRSITGSTALVAAGSQTLSYAIAGADGTAIAMQGAPTESFTPLVGWLDADRVVVLSQGNDETSRIVVVNLSKQSSATIKTLSGVRYFALSGDRASVAAATDSGVYLGQVSAWLGGTQPAQIVALGPSQVVWDLCLDQAGTQLAMLSGSVADDGTVSDIHELGYTRTSSGWDKTFDAAVPFTKSLGQAWNG